jgi:DNA polymerase-3 subunit epsilon
VPSPLPTASLPAPDRPDDERARPLVEAEFVAVDVETNGRGGDDCELTEVGAVLVGGGELHERLESLVRPVAPLARGIQRLTGITQAMVDDAPPPEEILPRVAQLLRGRVLVAHSASFDVRALRQAFGRIDLPWPEPPVLCTIAMARRLAPLATRRGLAEVAAAVGVDPDGAHRALVDAETCARVFCALFPRLCAEAATVEEAVGVLGARRRARGRRTRRGAAGGDRPPGPRDEARPRAREERPDLSALPDDPGVYVFRDERGRPLYVGKSVSVRSRARSHFCRPAGWTGHAEVVDYRPTRSELGALVLENRLIKEWRPRGNVIGKRADGFVFLRARLEAPYPVLEVAAEPASGRAVNVGPLRGRAAAGELADQLSSLFGLRHCGRTMRRRDFPSAYGQMGRCLSPCLGDLDPNLYRRRLDEALGLFEEGGGSGAALIEHLERLMAAAAAERRYERAEVLRRRLDRVRDVLDRLGGLVEATHARSRLVLARHPTKATFDAFWVVAGRVVDWGPLPDDRGQLGRRTAAALARRRGDPRVVRPEEVDEIRIVAAWTAAHEPPELGLDGVVDARRLGAFVREAAVS